MFKLTVIQIIKQMDATLGKEVLIKQLKATSQRVSLLEQLASLENPIHIIASVEDKLVPINAVRKMQSKMPNATLTIVDNSGHMLPLESPEIIQDSIISGRQGEWMDIVANCLGLFFGLILSEIIKSKGVL